MKYLVFIFILLLLSIWLGLEISGGAGYVLIAYRHWTLETSLWVAILSLVILFIFFYLFFRLLGRTTRISKSVSRWRRMRHYRKGRYFTKIGLCELAEGNWESAETHLIKSSKLTKTPLINFLGAAKAANALQAFDRRDLYLRRAHLSTSDSKTAAALTQAQLQIESNQWEQALATLQHVHRIDPHQHYVITLLKQVYLHLSDWEGLRQLLPSLHKYKIETPESFEMLEQRVYLALLDTANLKGSKALKEMWDSFPRTHHHNVPLLKKYTRYLVERHEDNTAIHLIEHAIKKDWDIELVKIFGHAKGESPAKQLSIAEHWLKKHPHDSALLMCLGKLSIREKFWGKAKEYLEASQQLSSSAEVYRALGDVFLALDEKDLALENYRKGLQLLTS